MIDSCNHSTGIICGSCQQKNADESYLNELNEKIEQLQAELDRVKPVLDAARELIYRCDEVNFRLCFENFERAVNKERESDE